MVRPSIAFVVLAGAALCPASAGRLQAIPVDAVVPFDPHPVLAEGKWHLLYELYLTNLGRTDLALQRLEALDGAGRVLETIDGNALAADISRPGAPPNADRKIIGSGQRSIVFIDVTVPEQQPVPRALSHRLTFTPVRTIDQKDEATLDVAPVSVSRPHARSFGPPLRGGCWVASHALANDSSHRRTIIPLNGRAYLAQRYAIDWIRIGSDGQAFRADPAKNSNWSAYGAEVLAVADGTVAEVRDGIPENDPTSDRKAVTIDLETVGGNHVLLRLPSGGSVFYAHLKPGSVRVHVGERVRKGEIIGEVGNSGQADAPHLHIHVTDRPSALAAEGLPISFESFALQGHLPSLSVLANGQGWRPSGPSQMHRNEMPAENAVVQFPGGTSSCGSASSHE